MMNASILIRTTLLIVAVGVAVTACGRRPGTLDTPYEAAIEARKQADRDDFPLPPEPQKPEEDRSFILDRLI